MQVPFDAEWAPFGNRSAARSWDMEECGLSSRPKP